MLEQHLTALPVLSSESSQPNAVAKREVGSLLNNMGSCPERQLASKLVVTVTWPLAEEQRHCS